MNTHIINRYSKYKNENVAIYTKKQNEKQDVNQILIGKVTWMKMELEEFNTNIVEFVDSHTKGEYKEINRLIELVKNGYIKAVLIWDFGEIESELAKVLIEECLKKDVYINGFLTPLKNIS